MASFLIVVASIVAIIVQIQNGRGYSGASFCAAPTLSAIFVSSVASQMQIDFEGNYRVALILCSLGLIISIVIMLIPAVLVKRFEIINLKPKVRGWRMVFIYLSLIGMCLILLFGLTSMGQACGDAMKCRGITNFFGGNYIYTGLFLHLFLFNILSILLTLSLVAAIVKQRIARQRDTPTSPHWSDPT